MKRILLIMMCLAMALTCGCIQAHYTTVPNGPVEFKFLMMNESDIGDLDITAPGGWHVKATKIMNKTAIDQGIIAEAVIKAIAVP